MISNIILDLFVSLMNSVYGIISAFLNINVDLSGLASSLNFLGGIVYTTNAFVPYETFGAIFAVLFTLATVRFGMQWVNLIWP